MIEVFAFEIDLRTAKFVREPASKKQRRRASGKIFEQLLQFSVKCPVIANREISRSQLIKRRRKRLRNKPPAILTPISAFIWFVIHNASFAALMNAATFFGSFFPGEDS